MNGRTEIRRIQRVENNTVKIMDDPVVREVPLTVYLNGQEFVTLLYTPEMPEMLAIGFLRSEGLINGMQDIKSIRTDNEAGVVYVESGGSVLTEKLYGKRTITSGCGKGTIFFSVLDALKSNPVTSDLQIWPNQAVALMTLLQEKADLFRLTGGIHSAALCTPTEMLYFCEDIGRHNAVDKIIGLCLQEDVTLQDKMLMTSGRISSEILVKAAKVGIPCLISRSAPTTLSIELADNLGITLIGFARGRRFNIYTHGYRVADTEVEYENN